MMYVQQMLAQVQKAQEAARARQAVAAGEPEEQAQPAVQIDEWILQVGWGGMSGCMTGRRWTQVLALGHTLARCCSTHCCNAARLHNHAAVLCSIHQHLDPLVTHLTLLCLLVS